MIRWIFWDARPDLLGSRHGMFEENERITSRFKEEEWGRSRVKLV